MLKQYASRQNQDRELRREYQRVTFAEAKTIMTKSQSRHNAPTNVDCESKLDLFMLTGKNISRLLVELHRMRDQSKQASGQWRLRSAALWERCLKSVVKSFSKTCSSWRLNWNRSEHFLQQSFRVQGYQWKANLVETSTAHTSTATKLSPLQYLHCLSLIQEIWSNDMCNHT